MLIKFTVENYLSFRDKSTFSMIKSRERQLPEHVAPDNSGNYKTLRGAVIYGPNASGKSNLITAMNDACKFISATRGFKLDRPFRLDSSCASKPTSFEFEIKISGQAYLYGFQIYSGLIVSEYFHLINSKKKNKLIFTREVTEMGTVVNTNSRLLNLPSKEDENLRMFIRTTPTKKLFVTDFFEKMVAEELNSSALDIIHIPLIWACTRTKFFNLRSRAAPVELEFQIARNKEFVKKVRAILNAVDPTIKNIILQEQQEIPKAISDSTVLMDFIEENLDEKPLYIPSSMGRRRYIVTKIAGKIKVQNIVIRREDETGNNIDFELNEESEGTRRILDLVPLFLETNTDNLLVIDEVDKSLHPIITRMFHKLHYNHSPCQNRQLIIATHEHHLLSQDFYRRDEIWFIDKDRTGHSNLYSLTEYDSVRFDKDIRNDYLTGRYGAIPVV